MQWFRMYSEARNDAKLRYLSDAEFRVWFNLLCFSNEQQERGTIPPMPEKLLAVEVAGGNEGLLAATLEKLMMLAIIEKREDGSLSFINFRKRNYDHPSDHPEQVKERVRRYRIRKREQAVTRRNEDLATCNDPCNDHVTTCNDHVTTHTTDTDTEVHNPPSLSPLTKGGTTQVSAPQPEPKPETAKEPYTKDFEEFWHIYPRKVEKRRAFKCWRARLREGAKAEDLIRAAANYAQAMQGKSLDYIKHASTFLSRDRPYEDWLDPPEYLLAQEREPPPWDALPSYTVPYAPPPEPVITEEERRAAEATIAEIRTRIIRRGGSDGTETDEATESTGDPRSAAG